MQCSKNLHSIVSSFDYFVSAQQESALAVRLTSTERRPRVRGFGKRKVLAERYAAGETMAKLALEYECGEATIWRALQG
jgi:hypothetical protein